MIQVIVTEALHRLLTRRDLYCYLAIPLVIYMAYFAVCALDKPPALKDNAPPTRAVMAAHIKPTPTDKAEEVNVPVPLPPELVSVLVGACEGEGVPLELAVAVMEQESNFNPDAVSPSGCYGLMQLNPAYFSGGLSPADNIRAGVGYLGELLATYDTTAAAVTAYFYGPSERTSSWYSDEVLALTEHWKEALKDGC